MNFPILFHWRLLPCGHRSSITEDEQQRIESRIKYWEGSIPVRKRYEELAQAPYYAALFLEHLPQNLFDWLGHVLSQKNDPSERTLFYVEKQLQSTNAFLLRKGFLHFDAHFKNILIDSDRLYFTDFGLALCTDFELKSSEVNFFKQHLLYDRGMSSVGLVHRIMTHMYGEDLGPDFAGRLEKATLTANREVAHVLTRHGPAALVMADFFKKLRHESKQSPFPCELLTNSLSSV